MGKTEQETVELLISLLEDNLTDPASDRAANDKKWIYDDKIRDDISGYPRISVMPSNSSYNQLAVGASEQLEDQGIAIQIRTQKTDKFTIDAVQYRAEQLVDYFAKQVRNIIRNNHAYFVANDIQHLIPESKNREEIDGLVIESMTFLSVSVN